MPLYEYECDACGNRFEKIQKFSDPLVEVCPKCGSGPVHKLLSSPAIQFKGSGWYITDYGKKDGAKDTKAGSGGTKDTKEGSDSKAADTAKDTKPAAETATKPAETKSNS